MYGKKIKEDGKLGSETRAAIQTLQKKAKLPADGYPDYRLLSKIQTYNPKVGWAGVMPVKKPQKK